MRVDHITPPWVLNVNGTVSVQVFLVECVFKIYSRFQNENIYISSNMILNIPFRLLDIINFVKTSLLMLLSVARWTKVLNLNVISCVTS